MSAWIRPLAAMAAISLGCTEGAAVLQFVPESDVFGAVAVGATSTPHQLTLTNTGAGPTEPLSAALTGPAAADFALVDDTCAGRTLPPSGTCHVRATFAPSVTGARSATLELTSGSSASVAATLSGTGVDPALLRLIPAANPYDFGPVLAGGPGQTAVFLVRNDGGVPGGLLSLSLSGADAAMFTLGSDRCSGQAVPAGGSCTFAVTFHPPLSASGARSASLQLGAGLSVTLTGIAAHLAQLAWTPGSRDYGKRQVTLDDATGDYDLQLSNQGNLDTSAVTLTTTGDFLLIGQTCGANGSFTLAPAAACTATVRFRPSAGGARTGTAVATASQGAPAGAAASLTGAGQWLLQVSKTGAASGAVTSSPAGIDCDAANSDCSQLYDDGTAVTLTATPEPPATFTGWTGCAPAAGQPAQCTLTLDGTGAASGVNSVAAGFD